MGLNPGSPTFYRDRDLLKFLPQGGGPGSSMSRSAPRRRAQIEARTSSTMKQGRGEKTAIRLLREADILGRGAVHRRARQRDARDPRKTYRHGLGLATDSPNWSMLHAMALQPRFFQELRTTVEVYDFLEIQFRHADHEPGGDGTRRASRTGVMNNYGRFYRRRLSSTTLARNRCSAAFLLGFSTPSVGGYRRTFYDLGKPATGSRRRRTRVDFNLRRDRPSPKPNSTTGTALADKSARAAGGARRSRRK